MELNKIQQQVPGDGGTPSATGATGPSSKIKKAKGLLAASQSVVSEALSGDSAKFMRQTAQSGGE